MAIGRLDRWFRMDVEVYSIDKDRVDYGAPAVETLIASFKGWLRPLSVTERVTSDKLTALSTHRVYCSADEAGGFTEADVMKIDDVLYNIVAVIEPMNLDSHLQIDLKRAS